MEKVEEEIPSLSPGRSWEFGTLGTLRDSIF